MATRKIKTDSIEKSTSKSARIFLANANFPGDHEGNQMAELHAIINGLKIEMAEKRGIEQGKEKAKSDSRTRWQTAFNIITILISIVGLIISIIAILLTRQ